jgi:uncharacterized protein
MRVDLEAVVLQWGKALDVADHLLSKASDTAKAEGRTEAEVLEWRLAADMFPLKKQFELVAKLVRDWASRAVGDDGPPDLPAESVGDLRLSLSASRQLLFSLAPQRFADRDDIELTVELGQIQPRLSTGQWILGFATTNIIFHLSVAYAILRSQGVPLGKPDLFAGGL